jgi:uncharacterized protein involved in exopolysaccharide biosynthesis
MNAQQPQEITFLDLVKILITHKWVMLIVFVSVQVGAGIYSYTATHVYRAEILVSSADTKGSSGGLSSLMSAMGGGTGLASIGVRREKIVNAIATLRSEQFIRGFITENNVLPILYADNWDSETSDWKAPTVDNKPRLSDGSRAFKGIMTIDEGKNGLVTLTINWTDPDVAANWANKLVFKLNEQLRSSAIQEANQTIVFLNKEVEKTRIVELQQAIYFMIEEQINIRTMANIRQEYAFKVISAAIAPELDQYFSPRRSYIFILAIFLGLVLGAIASWLLYGIQHLRTEMDN